ncbi:MAG: membrane protein insertase YidC [Streptosporangiales bacterium]|nr:membrane protein insertase YidC [Streptosporangiales bacterium]
MLDPLYEAVAWVLIKIHAGLSTFLDPDGGAAWGLSIVLLTVCVRLLIFPLFVKQINSSRKMQELQPKVQELRKKFKNDKQKLNQETVKLYQESGANPLGGCLPLLVQFPIFISLFNVLRTVAMGQAKYGFTQELVDSARYAKIFHAPLAAQFLTGFGPMSADTGDLSSLGADPVMARVVIGIAVVVSSITTFLTVRQSVTRSIRQMPDNPMASQQKILMYLSPAFALFGLTLPIGVLIYWVTTNIWSLVQQHMVYRRYPLPGADDANGDNGGGGGKGGGPTGPPGGGLFRKKREEPAPEPVEEPKIVRRQPVKQTRSKRSGKR